MHKLSYDSLSIQKINQNQTYVLLKPLKHCLGCCPCLCAHSSYWQNKNMDLSSFETRIFLM